MKFESKKKMLDISVNGQSYKMALPSLADSEELEESISKAEGKGVIKVYQDLFARLGFPVEAQKQMDSSDFFEFITFVLNPKKNSSPGT